MNINKEDALEYHRKIRPGKIEIKPTKSLLSSRELSLAYSPGVAYPCFEIEENPQKAYEYTAKGNLVGVITNGSAVLGLGNIGPLAGKPVMEGKGVLFKKFADIDVFDIELDTGDALSRVLSIVMDQIRQSKQFSECIVSQIFDIVMTSTIRYFNLGPQQPLLC